jgi:hypothetical protein
VVFTSSPMLGEVSMAGSGWRIRSLCLRAARDDTARVPTALQVLHGVPVFCACVRRCSRLRCRAARPSRRVQT